MMNSGRQNIYRTPSADGDDGREIHLKKPHSVLQLFVFKGEQYLGMDCFAKEKITIGSSPRADLTLSDGRVSKVHAVVKTKNDKIYTWSVSGPESKIVRKSPTAMGPLDILEIGPYSIKIKQKQLPTETIETPVSESAPKTTTPAPSDKTRVQEQATIPVIPSDLPTDSRRETSRHMKRSLEDLPGEVPQKSLQIEKVPIPSTIPKSPLYPTGADEEDEEDPDPPANFLLRDKLTDPAKERSGRYAGAKDKPVVLEVVKSRGVQVVDVQYLSGNQKYYIWVQKRNRARKFCLLECKTGNRQFLYIKPDFDVTITDGKENHQKADAICRPDRMYRRRQQLYRHPILPDTRIHFSDGINEFVIRSKIPLFSPQVPVIQTGDNRFFRHLVKSGVVHLFLMVFVGFFATIAPPERAIEESRFVRIDRDQLRALQQKAVLPPPKPKPLKPEKIEVPKKQPPEPVKTQPPTPKTVARNKEVPQKAVAQPAAASRHPKAGGGYGEGNVKTRNINQTGILSLLGNSVGIQPDSAIAAVTNLDAVSTTANVNNAYKVSGVVGKVGNGKIEIPVSGIVNTKGSSQVLRSAGAGGRGYIAALEKGAVGDGQVMGMVTAKMNKSVRIQGGMSREAVKRVIDQHMAEITNCYENALIVNPSIMGKAVFEWKILLSGKVGEVRIKTSSINSGEIHACIQAAIRSWQFPAPTGSEVVVSYPFIFDIVGF